MKRFFTFAALLSATAIAFSGCTDILDENAGAGAGTPSVKKVDITAHAGIDTRTVIGEKNGESYPMTWEDNDALFYAEVYDGRGDFTLSNDDDETKSESIEAHGKSATFTLRKVANTEGTFHAYYPYDAVIEFNHNGTDNYAIIDFPRVQTPEAGKKIDPRGAVMYGTATCEGDAESVAEGIDLDFQHIAAYGHITIKKFQSEMKPEGEIEYIRFIAKDGFYLSGEYIHDCDKDDNNEYASEAQLCYSDVIVMNDNNIFTVSDEINLWFACLPNNGEIKDFALRIKMKNGDEYRKSVWGGSIQFKPGEISEFALNCEKDCEKMPDGTGPYTLTNRMEDIKGCKDLDIIIADKRTHNSDSGPYAIGEQRASNYRDRKLVTDFEENIITKKKNDGIYVLKLTEIETGVFTIYDPETNDGGYLYTDTESSNYLKTGTPTSSDLPDYYTWTINFSDDNVLISNNHYNRTICHNPGDTRFSGYKEENSSVFYPQLFIPVKEGIMALNQTISYNDVNPSFTFIATEEVRTVRVSDYDGIITDAHVEGNQVLYSVSKNTTDKERTGSIELADDNNKYVLRIQVVQKIYTIDAPTISEVFADSESIMAEWSKVDDAVKYKWAITTSETETPEKALYKDYSDETDENELYEYMDFEDGQYYLYVKSVAENGTESAWSAGYEFYVGEEPLITKGKTYTFTVTNQIWSSLNTYTYQNIAWTPAASDTFTNYAYDDIGGQQFGSNSTYPKEITLTGSGYSNYCNSDLECGINTIVITSSANSKKNLSVAVSVGGVAMSGENTSFQGTNPKTTLVSTFTSNELLTGDIVITFTGNGPTYFKEVKIN